MTSKPEHLFDSGYIATAKPAVLGWMESIRCPDQGWGRWKYNAAMNRPWALQASGIAIRILHELGELGKIDEARRAEAVAFFQSCQSAADGLFRDPLETDADHSGPHSWEQIWGQRHDAAVEALKYLDADPKHPLPAAQFVDLSTTDGRSFTLERINWINPWGHGESWARAIRAYLLNPAHTPDDAVLSDALDAFEQHILDPITGTPNRRMTDPDPSRAMAGLFKTMMGYHAVGRPWPCAEAGIDSTLALQHADGEFGYRNNMCINWDAAWVLLHLDQQLDGGHRHDEIVESGRRLADHLMRRYQKPDGGFAFHGDHCQTNHHSIRLCDERLPIADMLGTTMALKCLAYADGWLAGN